MDIVHVIEIKATPERLYQAITSQKGLAGWWVPKTKAKAKVGALNEFTFGAYVVKFRVETLRPEREVVWSSVDVPPRVGRHAGPLRHHA